MRKFIGFLVNKKKEKRQAKMVWLNVDVVGVCKFYYMHYKRES